MPEFTFNAAGELEVTPSAASSQHDFDFYVGKWKIHNRKLNSRLTNSDEWSEFEADQEMELILNGLGNTDNFVTSFDGEPFEGRTLRLFNPATRLWSMYWVDSNSAVLQSPTVGSFDGDIGRFYDLDTFEGREILVKFEWNKSDPTNPVWSQAFSVDQGQTWEWNWHMYSRRSEA
ncbi:MAG: hypothetical protein ACRBK7_27900 [Acidimicrobiales bacterium]